MGVEEGGRRTRGPEESWRRGSGGRVTLRVAEGVLGDRGTRPGREAAPGPRVGVVFPSSLP